MGYLSYKSKIELIYKFSPVVGTLISVTSVHHFSLGFLALKSLLRYYRLFLMGYIFYSYTLRIFYKFDLISCKCQYQNVEKLQHGNE